MPRKRKVAILTYENKFETYNDQLGDEFEGTEVVAYGSEFSYPILTRKAKLIENDGYDAIVARGCTYGLIKDHINLPIIIVEPNLLDVLATMVKLNPEKGERVGLLFHENNSLLQYKDLPGYLNSIFGVEVEINSYKNVKDYFPKADEMLKRGLTLFSGYNELKRAKELGGKSIPLLIGENAMRDAIDEAIKIIDIRDRDANHNKKIETILSDKNEGIVNLDSSLKVQWINDYARNVLSIPSGESAEDIDFKKHMPELSWKNIFVRNYDNVVLKEGETSLIVNTKVFHNHTGEKEVFIFFRRAANVVEEEKKIRAEMHKKKQYAKFNLDDIKGSSQALLDAKERTKQCARFNSNILIYGESGVGKELFAQCIHNESERAREPFYAVNCAALPENLLESELFGYSEGSFTGAKKGGKAGIFELAHRGTVFLDEIGELSLASQSALLRVLQEKEIRRIGDDGVIPVDVRVIAASHKDIYHEVEEKRFRQDLFYRLNTVFLTIPPLRERKEDIIELMDFFTATYAGKYGLAYTGSLNQDAYDYLLNYKWEGNVRELQNFVQRIFVLGYHDKVLSAADVRGLLTNSPDEMPAPAETPSSKVMETAPSKPEKHRITDEDIAAALQQAGGSKTEAAKLLGISRTHLWRLINNK
ncbi:MAG: sigma 54-interacting transcriptional regulator [Firmicutes bacterium]|nr:sigma 54-interacting transcriptional regulator [Bacillota bacterium]